MFSSEPERPDHNKVQNPSSATLEKRMRVLDKNVSDYMHEDFLMPDRDKGQRQETASD